MDDLLAHREFVRGIVRGLVQDEARIDDAVQDTWLAALQRPPRQAIGLRSWLAKVARNCARKAFRSERRRARRERAAATPEAVASTGQAVERASRSRQVLDAVLALEEPLRTTVLLRYYDGLSAEEIAERFGITSAAVRKRIGVASALLREKLAEHHDGDFRSYCLGMLPLVAFPEPLLAASAAKPAVGWAKASLLAPALAAATVTCLVALFWRPGTDASARGGPAAPEAAATAVPEDAATSKGAAAAVAFRLRGTVRDAEGRPVEGAHVEAAAARAVTAADGTFAVPGFAAGWIDVRASRQGYLPWQDAVDPLLDEEILVTLRRGAPLRVRVLDPLRSPFPGARVCAKHRTTRGVTGMWTAEQVTALGSGTTDERGCAELGTSPVGRVTVTVSGEGFALARTSVEVAGADPVECEVVLSPGGTVEGRVLDADGLPVAGALVHLADLPRPTTLSQPDGSYELEGVPEGEVRIVAILEDRALGFFGAALGWGHPVPIPMRSGETVTGADIVMERAAFVAGRIVDDRGAPVAGVSIRLAEPESAMALAQEVVTDADGRFRLGLRALGRTAAVVLAFTSDATATRSLEVDLPDPGATVDIGDLEAARSGLVRGRVVDPGGVPFARGRVVVADGPTVAFGPDGAFELRGAGPGPVRLHAEAAGSPARRSHAVVLDLDAGGVAEVEIALHATISVTGHVLGPHGSPQGRVLVGARSEGARGTCVVVPTDARGRFEFALPAAEHVVGIVAPSDPREARLGARLPFTNDPVSVRIVREGGAEDADDPELEADPVPVLVRGDEELLFRLPAKGAVVRGRVGSRRGPVLEFELDFVRYRGLLPRSCESRIVRDSSGSFSEELVECGLWAVEVRAPGHAVHRTPLFTIEAGVAVDLGTIELSGGGGVQGSVTDAFGGPVEHARVHLVRADWLTNAESPYTDRDGNFELRAVAPGPYRLFVVSPRHPLGVVGSVTVEAGATTRVEVRLPEPVRATLRVTDESGLPIRGAEVYCVHPDLAPLSSRILAAYEPPGWGAWETDEEGLVVKPYAPPIPVLVRIRAPGFASKTEVVTLHRVPDLTAEVRLVRLPPGGVEAEAEER